MAVSTDDMQAIRQWLIANGTDVTGLPTQTTFLDTIAVTAVNTSTGQVVSVPLTAFAEWAETLNTQNADGAAKALRAAAGAAKAQKDLETALQNLAGTQAAAETLISNIGAAILDYLRPITQAEYDAIVDAGTLEDRPYLIYED